MTIIIETTTTTRERLVLVSHGEGPRTTERDATPDDLARGGYVPVERAEKAERVAAMAKDIDGHTMADLRDDLRNASARYDEVWAAIGTTSALANDTAPNIILAMREDIIGLNADTERLLARAEKAERELEVAMRERNDAIEASSVALSAKSKAERERDEAKRHAGDAADALARLMRERDTLRAELARLTLVDEEEPTDAALRDAFAEGERKRDARHVASPLRIAYRLGVAHERTRQQPRDRATDEELFDIGERARLDTPADPAMNNPEDGLRCAAYLAVAARVRQERCLVAQAVAADCDIHVTEDISGAWCVRVLAPTGDAYGTPTVTSRTEVPTTLARLLGEVSKC